MYWHLGFWARRLIGIPVHEEDGREAIIKIQEQVGGYTEIPSGMSDGVEEDPVHVHPDQAHLRLPAG